MLYLIRINFSELFTLHWPYINDSISLTAGGNDHLLSLGDKETTHITLEDIPWELFNLNKVYPILTPLEIIISDGSIES